MKCIVCHSEKPDSDFPQIIGGEVDQGQSSVGDKSSVLRKYEWRV
jgi:hypothetical protein